MTPAKDPIAKEPLPSQPPGRALEIGGAALSLLWVAVIFAYVLMAPPGSDAQTFGLVLTLLMVFLPVALIWVVVTTLRSVRELRAEAARLQATVDAMRASYVQTQAQQPASSQMRSSVEKKIDEIAAMTRQAETVLATFTSRRDAGLAPPSADRKVTLVRPAAAPSAEEPALALGAPPEDTRPPLSVGDFIRALQFPESPEDKDPGCADAA